MTPLTNVSKNAKKFNDAYFTSKQDAVWALSQLEGLYDLKGKTALEPAAGAGIFVTAKNSGLKWTTNELYPENNRGFKSDFTLDFAKDDISALGKYDFVITNPPFGQSNALARKFILRSLEIANVVAMVLPKGIRSGKFIDKVLPKDVKIVFDEDTPHSLYLLPDNSIRRIGTCFVVYERVPGYTRPKVLEYEAEGFRIEGGGNEWPDWATCGMCNWGSASGVIQTREKRPTMFAGSLYMDLTPEQVKAVPESKLVGIASRKATTVPAISREDVITVLNPIFRNL